MRIAVLALRSLRGTGFATRITSMVEWYAAAGHEVDVFHYRFAHEEKLPDPVATTVRRYVTVPLGGARFRQHATLLPPLAWQCHRAPSPVSEGSRRYDIVQAETSNTWSVARRLPCRKRLLVLHDDDAVRLRTIAMIAPKLRHRIAAGLSSRKYSRWQRIAIQEADRTWFVSGSELDRLGSTRPGQTTRLIPNGASDELFSVPLPSETSGREVLFVGPRSYEANARGLDWFLRHPWPLIRQRVSGAHLRVVGVGWEDFGLHPGVSFVGWSDSLADEYARSRIAIAPLFAGGGTKTKVVEAMAAARPVVATSPAAEAIPRSEGMRVCNEAGSFADEVSRFLTHTDAARRAGASNRRTVDSLRWSAVWERADRDLESLMQ